MTVDEENDALDDSVQRLGLRSRASRATASETGGSRATGKGFHAQQSDHAFVGEAQREAAVGRDLQVHGGALEVVRVRQVPARPARRARSAARGTI